MLDFKNKKILIVGAHPDDIELGMGGTLSKLTREGHKRNIQIDVFSSTSNVNGVVIEDEFWESMKYFGTTLRTCLYQDIKTMEFYKYEDYIKNRLYYTRVHFKPDIIFSTSPKSDNRDHEVLGKCVLNIFQEQSVLFYEDIRGGREHRADLYIPLKMNDMAAKIASTRFYRTQKDRSYFRPGAILSMLEFRGSQIGKLMAESFEVARLMV